MDRVNSPRAKAARRAFVLQGRFRRFFSNLGPGLITGAAFGAAVMAIATVLMFVTAA